MSLQLPELVNYIGGTTCVPEIDRDNCVRDPNTREPLQAQLSSSEVQIESALATSHEAYTRGEWERTSATERADLLDRVADRLDTDDIKIAIAHADAITTGAIIKTTRRMAQLAPFVFRHAAQYIRDGNLAQTLPGALGDVEYFRRPWGPALLISPWNGPTAIGSHKIASALAAGAPCILKPSEWAPHSALIMAQVIEQAGLPAGTFQLTCGSRHIGSQMIEDPRVKAISFTGGLAGGRAISRASADQFTPLQLELGGNNPLVVFEDADLDLAATGIVYGLTNLNAQWCRALGRVLVHSSVKTALLAKVQEQLAPIRLGHSLDEESQMGPLIHEAQYNSVQGDIQRLLDSGGKAVAPTTLPDLPGYFVAPTLIDGCDPSATTEEIFGPVATVHTFTSDQQALKMANGTPYGLAAYIYSHDEERARKFAREVRAGGSKINGYSLLSLSGAAPRGAWGLSGLGEEGTAESIDFFTGARVVGVAPQEPVGG